MLKHESWHLRSAANTKCIPGVAGIHAQLLSLLIQQLLLHAPDLIQPGLGHLLDLVPLVGEPREQCQKDLAGSKGTQEETLLACSEFT